MSAGFRSNFDRQSHFTQHRFCFGGREGTLCEFHCFFYFFHIVIHVFFCQNPFQTLLLLFRSLFFSHFIYSLSIPFFVELVLFNFLYSHIKLLCVLPISKIINEYFFSKYVFEVVISSLSSVNFSSTFINLILYFKYNNSLSTEFCHLGADRHSSNSAGKKDKATVGTPRVFNES